jgi:hypothetical protein
LLVAVLAEPETVVQAVAVLTVALVVALVV